MYIFMDWMEIESKPMGQILDLIPICDTVTKLQGICYVCKFKASIFSHRITDNKDQVLFDHTKYVPLCRSCYLIENDMTESNMEY